MSKNDTHATSCCCYLVIPSVKIERVKVFVEYEIPTADVGRRLRTTSSRDGVVAECVCARSCADDQQNRYHGEWPLQCGVLALKRIFIES